MGLLLLNFRGNYQNRLMCVDCSYSVQYQCRFFDTVKCLNSITAFMLHFSVQRNIRYYSSSFLLLEFPVEIHFVCSLLVAIHNLIIVMWVWFIDSLVDWWLITTDDSCLVWCHQFLSSSVVGTVLLLGVIMPSNTSCHMSCTCLSALTHSSVHCAVWYSIPDVSVHHYQPLSC